MPDLLAVVKTAAQLTDRVLVGYSGGKDSVVTLDLCARHFRNVRAFFMYQVPGLSFQEKALRWAEHRYALEIIRIPHFEVSAFLRRGTYHEPDATVRPVSVAETYAYLRELTGFYWIAAGERIADSTVRRAMIVKDGSINQHRGRIYPLADWRKHHVAAYIKQRRLRVSEEAAVLGHSFRDLSPRTLLSVKQHYPADYDRILSMYPEAEAGVQWEILYGSGQSQEQPEQIPAV